MRTTMTTNFNIKNNNINVNNNIQTNDKDVSSQGFLQLFCGSVHFSFQDNL